jgi:hypothetical protein
MASLDRDGVDRRLACSERVLGWLNPSRLQVRMSTQYPHRRDTTHPKLLAFAAFNIHSLTLPGHAHMRSDQAPLLIGSDLALHRIAEGSTRGVHHGQPSCSRVESSALPPDAARPLGRLRRGLEDPDRRVERASGAAGIDGLSRACSGAWQRRMLDAATER